MRLELWAVAGGSEPEREASDDRVSSRPPPSLSFPQRHRPPADHMNGTLIDMLANIKVSSMSPWPRRLSSPTARNIYRLSWTLRRQARGPRLWRQLDRLLLQQLISLAMYSHARRPVHPCRSRSAMFVELAEVCHHRRPAREPSRPTPVSSLTDIHLPPTDNTHLVSAPQSRTRPCPPFSSVSRRTRPYEPDGRRQGRLAPVQAVRQPGPLLPSAGTRSKILQHRRDNVHSQGPSPSFSTRAGSHRRARD